MSKFENQKSPNFSSQSQNFASLGGQQAGGGRKFQKDIGGVDEKIFSLQNGRQNQQNLSKI